MHQDTYLISYMSYLGIDEIIKDILCEELCYMSVSGREQGIISKWGAWKVK